MPQTITVKASTTDMRKNKETPVSQDFVFPVSIAEIKAGIGPWESVAEMFQDAVAHRKVRIQADMRQALESGEEVENGKASKVRFED